MDTCIICFSYYTFILRFKFYKKQLGIGSTTTNCAVLGEKAAYPTCIKCYRNVIKYWSKLIALPEGSLLKSCYNLLYMHANAGTHYWAQVVKNILFRNGFGYVWEEQ